MNHRTRTFILALCALLILTAIVIYGTRGSIRDAYKGYIERHLASSLERGVKIEKVSDISLKGVRLSGISVYRDEQYGKKLFSLSHVYIRFSLPKLFKEKVFAATLWFDDAAIGNARINGAFSFSSRLGVHGEGELEDILKKIPNIGFHDLTVAGPVFAIQRLNGSINIDTGSIRSSGMRCFISDAPCEVDLNVSDPAGELSAELDISSRDIKLHATVEKEEEIFRMPAMKGSFANSSFEIMGELSNLEEPTVSLYGTVLLDIGDASRYAPGEFEKVVQELDLEGTVENTVFFKGKLKNFSGWEGGIKSKSESLKIWHFDFKDFYMDTRITGGKITIPILTAYPYGGALSSSMMFDPTHEETVPYEIECKLSDVDIGMLLGHTDLKNRDIRGRLMSDCAVRGDAKDIDEMLRSMTGHGSIFIRDANLGPMPLLTPLIGNLYGFFQKLVPGLNKINITEASAHFSISDKQIATDDLVLWGGVVNIHAKGYVDFDKNIDFEVENEIVEPEEGQDDDWQTSLQEMIIQFGKLAGKARLTGTLQKPEWNFQYLGGVPGIFGGGIQKFFKGLFED